jgi:hypothetical protein
MAYAMATGQDGVSRMQVSRLISHALGYLRRLLLG